MPIEISLITEADIPGAIDAIQKAFADDPYNLWVYNDRTKVSHFKYKLPIRTSFRSSPSREVSESLGLGQERQALPSLNPSPCQCRTSELETG